MILTDLAEADDGVIPDDHAKHVHDALVARGLEAIIIDASTFPTTLQCSMRLHGAPTFSKPDGSLVSFDDIQSVYWRQYGSPATPTLPNAEQSYIASNDARGMFESILIEATIDPATCRWVNGYQGWLLHQTKPAQLRRVVTLQKRLTESNDWPTNLTVPATLWTNDPDQVRTFANEHGPCIFKPIQGGAHTRPLTEEHLLPDRLKQLQFAPVTIQQKIEGTDIRVFVAGNDVYACEIGSSKLDFRDDLEPQIKPLSLPQDITNTCIRIARELKLAWTGIDLRRTDQGQFYYFEANPSPMFLGFEHQTNLPLTQALLGLLIDE